MVIKAAGVPLDSPCIREARKHKIPVEMDASLFARLAPARAPRAGGPKGVTIVGVTGTRGKSTVSHLIHHIISRRVLDIDSARRGFFGWKYTRDGNASAFEKGENGRYCCVGA